MSKALIKMVCTDCVPSEGPVQKVNGHANGITDTHVGIDNKALTKQKAEQPRGSVSAQPFGNVTAGNLANFKIIERCVV